MGDVQLIITDSAYVERDVTEHRLSNTVCNEVGTVSSNATTVWKL